MISLCTFDYTTHLFIHTKRVKIAIRLPWLLTPFTYLLQESWQCRQAFSCAQETALAEYICITSIAEMVSLSKFHLQ